jgi:hypothetical protein
MKFQPQTTTAYLLLTADTPISHHDPAAADGSNMLTFNRQKQHITLDAPGAAQWQPGAMQRFADANPVPETVAEIVRGLSFTEFAACALVRMAIDIYNSMEGTGLFSGVERYALLESRLRSAAVRSHTLRGLWAHLTRDLRLPVHGGDYDLSIGAFFALPDATQRAVIAAIIDQYRSIVTIARVWHAQGKLQFDQYAAAAGLGAVAMTTLTFTDPHQLGANDHAPAAPSSLVIEVPAVSTNSLRHQAARGPAWQHLRGALDLTDELRPGVKAIFENGGNIAAGAKQPSNAFHLANKIRQVWPSLDLLGGVTDSFDLGESQLRPSAWLVCRENRRALAGTPAEGLDMANVSAFDLLDDVTATRQATREGVGQMIYNFEALCPGTQILLRLSTLPFTRAITIGALVAAVQTWLGNLAVVAGQSARGFGNVSAEWLQGFEGDNELREEYEAYLDANRETLVAGLADGTLGSGAVVLK